MIKLKQEDKRYHIDTTRKVFVYKNLHKDCWSIKQDGLVKAHTHDLDLWDCSFQVNAKGRAKVLEEKRKNVHAGVKGYIDCLGQGEYSSWAHHCEVTYNPYKYDSFVDKDSEEPVYFSSYAKLSRKQVLVA
jgi:hypothetical protein